jgi:hypothetical protein
MTRYLNVARYGAQRTGEVNDHAAPSATHVVRSGEVEQYPKVMLISPKTETPTPIHPLNPPQVRDLHDVQ